MMRICIGRKDGRWFVLCLQGETLVKVYPTDKGARTLGEALQVMLALQNKVGYEQREI